MGGAGGPREEGVVREVGGGNAHVADGRAERAAARRDMMERKDHTSSTPVDADPPSTTTPTLPPTTHNIDSAAAGSDSQKRGQRKRKSATE